MNIELRDLEYFAAVGARGNVGRAAEDLGLSQPALSKSLRRLEKAVGAKLVTRTPKGVDLTAVGSALFARARRLCLSLDDIAREAADLSQGRAGHLRIGTGTRYAVDVVPAACAALLKEAPAVLLSITVGSVDIVATALLRGELDLSVMGNPQIDNDDLLREQLWEDEVVVYASIKHRLAGRKKVALAEVAQERWALTKIGASRERLCRAFAENGLPPPMIAVETNAVLIRRNLLPMTDLLSFVPRQLLGERGSRARLAEIPVEGLAGRQSINVYYRKDAYLSPAARRFIEILKATAREIAKENR
jgi:DNA-binding transcriptional LysR family regulator